MSYIVLKDIHKTYGVSVKQEVLNGTNMEIEKGQIVAITGVSGSGKTTLLGILGLLDSDYSGNYYLNGVDISELSDKDIAVLRNKEFGFIYQ